jgi:hypothetical protein
MPDKIHPWTSESIMRVPGSSPEEEVVEFNRWIFVGLISTFSLILTCAVSTAEESRKRIARIKGLRIAKQVVVFISPFSKIKACSFVCAA